MTETTRSKDDLGDAFWHAPHPFDGVLPPLDGHDLAPAQFALLADHIPTACWIARGDGYIVWYNQRWHQYCGTTPEAMEGWGWQDVHDPVTLPQVMARWVASINLGQPFEMVFPLRGADGVFRPFLTRISPLRDATGDIVRWFGVNMEIGAQIRAEDALRAAAAHNQLLTRELSHRIKNIFAIISSLIRVSLRRDPGARNFARDLLDRIHALGRAHEFARPHSDESLPKNSGSQLQGLLSELFLPYQEVDRRRIRVTGSDAEIDDKGATPIALLFHELATNAVKYGALSGADGTVDLDIVARDDELELTWRETGGPAIVTAPIREGFGTKLASMSINQQLGGRFEQHWLPTGLIAIVTVKRSNLFRTN